MQSTLPIISFEGDTTSFSDIDAIKDALAGDDSLKFILAVLSIGFTAGAFVYKQIKVTWYKRVIILLLVAFCSLFIGVKLAFIPLIVVSGASLSLIIAVGIGIWLDCRRKLVRIVELADPM